MRVAVVTTSLDPGGAETALVSLVLGLTSSGVQASVFSLRGSGRLVSRLREVGAEVWPLQVTSVSSAIFSMPFVLREMRRFKPDIVQGWMYHGNLVATVAALACDGCLLWGIRQSLGAQERERATTNRLIRFGAQLSTRPGRIIYNSHRARTEHESIGYAPSKGIVIANGFDTDALRPDATGRARLRQRMQLSEDTILIGHIARYHPVKDHATFLEAASALSNRGLRVHFLMAGRGVNATNEALTSEIERLGLTKLVTLHGEASDVSLILTGLDVLCVSSRSEAFPNVIGEAMSCGIPCVTTDVGDAAQVVCGIGQVVQPGKPGLLADALGTVAQLGPEERARMGLAARRRVVERYSLRSMIDQYIRLYGGMLRPH